MLTQSANAADVETVINDKNRVCEGSDRGLDNKEDSAFEACHSKRTARFKGRIDSASKIIRRLLLCTPATENKYGNCRAYIRNCPPPDLVAPALWNWWCGRHSMEPMRYGYLEKTFQTCVSKSNKNRSEMKHFPNCPQVSRQSINTSELVQTV